MQPPACQVVLSTPALHQTGTASSHVVVCRPLQDEIENLENIFPNRSEKILLVRNGSTLLLKFVISKCNPFHPVFYCCLSLWLL